MKTQSALKIKLTQDNHCHIEENCGKHIKQEDKLSSLILNQPQPIITGNSNMIISDPYANNSDILSISKTDSNISIYSVLYQKEKHNHSSSNLLISFSNISEADPKLNYKDTDSLSINFNISSNSILFKKDQSKLQKSNSFTPSTLCNYYLRSNDVTPNKGIDINMFNQSIKQTNLNLIYCSMNNTNIDDKENNSSFQQGKSSSSKKNVIALIPQDKKTPLKSNKTQLKNEGECEIERGKKNLMLLFNDGEDIIDNCNINDVNYSHEKCKDLLDYIQIKDNNYINKEDNTTFNIYINKNNNTNTKCKLNYKIETINNFSIEKIVNQPKEISFPLSPNNYSNFSFDITRNNNFFKSNKKEDTNNNNVIEGNKESNQIINIKGIPRQNITNHESNGNLNWINSNYVSPKFINRVKLNDSNGKVSTIQSTNSDKKKSQTIEDNSHINNAANKIKQKEHNKYVSSFTLPTNQKNISPQQNRKIIRQYNNNSNAVDTTQKHLKACSISPKSNSSKQKGSSTKAIKRNFSFLNHDTNNNIIINHIRPNSSSKSRLKEKRNTSTNSNSNKVKETSKAIIKKKLKTNSLLNVKYKNRNTNTNNNKAQLCLNHQSNNTQININIIQKIKKETSSNLVNFINTLNPIPILKESLNKSKKSPSPPQVSGIGKQPKIAHINLTNLLKKNITEKKNNPIQTKHNNIQTFIHKFEDNSSANTTKLINNSHLSTMGKDISNSEISNQKKQPKVIQNFSNYKKKTSNQKHFGVKDKDNNRDINGTTKLRSIISNKLQKLEGDEDMNILIEDV